MWRRRVERRSVLFTESCWCVYTIVFTESYRLTIEDDILRDHLWRHVEAKVQHTYMLHFCFIVLPPHLWRSTWPHIGTHWNPLQRTATHIYVALSLHHVCFAMRCSAFSVCSYVSQCVASEIQRPRVEAKVQHMCVVQCVAVCRNALRQKCGDDALNRKCIIDSGSNGVT